MEEVAVAFAGKIGSGKSSLAQGLSSLFNWKYASFGNYVRLVADRRHVTHDRRSLQNIGEELSHDWPSFCAAVIGQSGWNPGDGICVDGVRHVEALVAIRKLLFPTPCLLVYADLPNKVRRERLMGRAEPSFVGDEGSIEEQHSTEVQVPKLRWLADTVVDSSRPLIDILDELQAFVYIWSTNDSLHDRRQINNPSDQ